MRLGEWHNSNAIGQQQAVFSTYRIVVVEEGLDTVLLHSFDAQEKGVLAKPVYNEDARGWKLGDAGDLFPVFWGHSWLPPNLIPRHGDVSRTYLADLQRLVVCNPYFLIRGRVGHGVEYVLESKRDGCRGGTAVDGHEAAWPSASDVSALVSVENSFDRMRACQWHDGQEHRENKYAADCPHAVDAVEGGGGNGGDHSSD